MDVAKEEADWFGAGGTRRDKNGGLELLEVNRTSDMLWWLAGWLHWRMCVGRAHIMWRILQIHKFSAAASTTRSKSTTFVRSRIEKAASGGDPFARSFLSKAATLWVCVIGANLG